MKLQKSPQFPLPSLTSSINHSILSQPEMDGTILLTRPEVDFAMFELSHSCMFLYIVLWHVTTCTDFISTPAVRCRTVYVLKIIIKAMCNSVCIKQLYKDTESPL